MLYSVKSLSMVNRLLLSISLFSFILSVTRIFLSDSFVFIFLNWNLFLASVPYFLSLSIQKIKKGNYRKVKIIALLIVWLLFFPNAPYILTDLFHLRIKTGVPIWFDLILIISFAWAGLLFGFLSLIKIEQLLLLFLSSRQIAWLSSIILFLASFGVYLGRFLRWNSWDVFNQPSILFYDIFNRVINPFEHPRTWGVTLLFGVLLNLIYWTIKVLGNQVKQKSREEFFII